ncbi:SLBB domain-containing protein [Rhodospirillum centenum]|uniref:Polysaccharide biosynthesis n=1 Tax=Rhodospirillum centenum (strain ATCC 51521 / SW) TaxID=414684 RepID=B6IRK7_RHOCS|nr:SLBB domain-containing protein [Rhodospirillum centenum]ACI98093.1 polysaccharide biosynthesis [Rhodospirillum centenum SW]
MRLLLLVILLLLPVAVAAQEEEPSRLEALYSERAGEPLRRFGATVFDGRSAPTGPVLGAVADDHPLKAGDEVTVILRGQTSGSRTYAVGTDGMLAPDDLRPIAAAGRPLGEVRRQIVAEVAAVLPQTEAFVSLSRPRRLTALVLGEVTRPGRHDLPAFASVLDALYAAGGVAGTGSLRAIRVLEPGGPPGGVAVDLYDLLRDGTGTADRRLPDGSRIVVPTLGATVAVAGAVKRPGIYELPPGEPRLSLESLLDLAGGPLRPGPERALRLSFGHDGAERSTAVADPGAPLFGDGDVLLYAPARSDRLGTVTLGGHVRQPGPRSLGEAPTLERLLPPAELGPAPYLPFAALVRRSERIGARTLLPVDLSRPGDPDRGQPLADGDRLLVLGEADVAFLSSRRVLALLAGESPAADDGDCPALGALSARLAADPTGPLAAGAPARTAAALSGPDLPCPALFAAEPDLLPFALEHAALLRRGVLRPGLYPAAPGAAPTALVRAAGGVVGAGAAVASALPADRILDVGPPGVELAGAVRRPGVRPLAAARTLRALLGDGDVLAPDAYGLLAVVERFDRAGVARSLIPFAPVDVLAGTLDRALRDGDRVVILDSGWVRSLALGTGPEAALTGPDADLARLALDRVVQVRGAVTVPGAYPVAQPATLRDLVAAAGGLALEADAAAVEIVPALGKPPADGEGGDARPHRIDLSGPAGLTARAGPGDGIRVPARFHPREPRWVEIAGEVRQPGRYDLAPGERLSSLIARAGGLTPDAYPDGAVFTRDSARRAEEEGFRRVAAEMDRGLALALLRESPPSPAQVELTRQLADSLRAVRAVGRITVEADPAALASDPTADILLEPGDRILFPKRPLTVTVSGEVLSPASLRFVPGKEAADYLREAGGLTRFADRGLIFVLYPDGSSQPLAAPRGRYALLTIPPGSTLVVPRDPEPFEFLPVAQSVTTILSQLALTAAAVTAILDDD